MRSKLPIDDSAAAALRAWQEVDDRPLFVYFIQAENGGPVKIGQAKNPLRRLDGLQVGNPERLVIRALVLATDELEQSVHARWRDAHIRGEWFGLGYEDAILSVAVHVSQEQLSRFRGGRSEDPRRVSARLHLATAYGERGLGLMALIEAERRVKEPV